MTMPFRQKHHRFCAPVGAHELKKVVQKDGSIKTVVDDEKIPPSKQFETAAMMEAGVPMNKVSSYFTLIPDPPQEVTTDNEV